ASPAKKAHVRIPRTATVAGTPAASRAVPGGWRTRNAQAATGRPTNASGTATTALTSAAASTAPTPATRASILTRRDRSSGSPVDRCRASTARSAGIAITPATSTKGTRPRNTSLQVQACSMRLAIAGPTNPGTIHAVDMVANMTGLMRAGNPRPIAEYATEGMAPAP